MKHVCQAIAVILLAIWVPATLHCQLENLPALGSFLSCCQHGEAPSPAHHQEECAMDNCADLESGLYKLPDRPTAIATLPALVLASLDFTTTHDRENACEAMPAPPPRLSPASWQFVMRTAPAVRAPSFAS